MASQLQTVASSAPFLVGSFAIDDAQFGVLIGLCPAAGHFYGLAGRHARAAFRRQTVGIGWSAAKDRRGSADGGRFVIPSGCSRPQIARFRCCSVCSLSRHPLITKTGLSRSPACCAADTSGTGRQAVFDGRTIRWRAAVLPFPPAASYAGMNTAARRRRRS